MTSRSLSRLLNPKSIALFGGAWAENVIRQLQKSGFEGNIWPVHPKRQSICDIPCFKNLNELPSAPDASFVGVNRELSIEIITDLSKMNAGGATCFASGFLESETEGTGGAELQQRLINAAGDMPILGPNCYGLINYLDNVTLWPDQHGGRRCPSGVAIVGQSSNVLINMTMQKRSLPIAYTIAAGNQAQTEMSDITSHLLDDERVTAIGLYVEGFGDIRKFEAMAAKARKLGKPVVAIKTGKSEKSKAATLTHTASLAGSSAASSAFMRRLGIIEVNSIGVFLETLKLLHAFGPLRGNSISSMSCSGGEAGLIADMAEDTKIEFRSLSPKNETRIKDVLGPLVTVTNPLDYHTFIWGDADKLEAVYKGVFDDDFDLNILIMDIPAEDRCDTSAWDSALLGLKRAAEKTDANIAMLATLPENLSETLGDELLADGIVPMHGMEEMIEAVDAAITAGEIIHETSKPVMLTKSRFDTETVLDEAKSKHELAQRGVVFPKSLTATSPAEAGKLSSTLAFPVALKGLGIAHKSEANAVVLNMQDSKEVEASANAMKNAPAFLVEEMVGNAVGEILIGVTRDTTGMFLLTIGAGGTLTELLGDTASLIVPASRAEVAMAFSSLKVAKLLSGFRNGPRADVEAAVDAIMAVQDYCLQTDNLIELDVNPLIVLKEGAIAVDALIKLGEPE